MRKDITVEKLMLGGKRVNKSALSRQYGCCWRTVDRRLNKYLDILELERMNIFFKERLH